MGRRSASRSRGSGGSSPSLPRKPKESGTVNSWNVERQFGFVSCDGNRSDVFLHAEGFRDVDVRDRVKKSGLKRPVLRWMVHASGDAPEAEAEVEVEGADDSESGSVGNSDPCANLADLSASLRSNSTLRRLDLQANYLEPHDLKVIFQSITPKSALQDLRVNFQASLAAPPVDFAQMMLSEAGTEIYKAAHKALEENKKLLKLDLSGPRGGFEGLGLGVGASIFIFDLFFFFLVGGGGEGLGFRGFSSCLGSLRVVGLGLYGLGCVCMYGLMQVCVHF
ncbi:unnamed protein product [Symbiodinium sp. CCMP2592]|nr:unnamed protein product [Symbiodinium sp. CCMP2592]